MSTEYIKTTDTKSPIISNIKPSMFPTYEKKNISKKNGKKRRKNKQRCFLEGNPIIYIYKRKMDS